MFGEEGRRQQTEDEDDEKEEEGRLYERKFNGESPSSNLMELHFSHYTQAHGI